MQSTDLVQSQFKRILYISLTIVLGILLFVVIQQSFALLYYILISFDYARYGFGFSPITFRFVYLGTTIASVFVGGLYGVWLGRYWFNLVYQQRAGRGFMPPLRNSSFPAQRVTPKVKVQSSARKEISEAWDLDDLLAPKQATASIVSVLKPAVKLSTKPSQTKSAVRVGQEKKATVSQINKTVSLKPKKRVVKTRTKVAAL
jgi:hypothetical protein